MKSMEKFQDKRDSDPDQFYIMDAYPTCPERLDPVNMRPNPKPLIFDKNRIECKYASRLAYVIVQGFIALNINNIEVKLPTKGIEISDY